MLCAALLSLAACDAASTRATPTQPAQSTASGDPASAPGGAPKPGVYRLITPLDVITLDPALANSIDDTWLCGTLLFSRLYSYDPDGQLQPDLAESFPVIANGTRYTIQLRANVRFHNGRALTADDARFSIARAMQAESGSWAAPMLSGLIDDIRAIDARTLEIRLARPFAGFTALLSISALGVLPAAEVEAAGDAWGHSVVIGSGPFKLAQWRTGESLRLERYAGYFKNVVSDASDGAVNAVEVTLNTVALVAMERWQNGEAEYVWFSDGSDEFKRVASDPALKVDARSAPSTIATRIEFNPSSTLAANLKLRQAIAGALDRAALAEQQLAAQPADGLLSNPSETASAIFDPATSRALLAESGLGPQLTISAISALPPAITRWVGERLAASGIQVAWLTPDAEAGEAVFVLRTRGTSSTDPRQMLEELDVRCDDAAAHWCDDQIKRLLFDFDLPISPPNSPDDKSRALIRAVDAQSWIVTLTRRAHIGLGVARVSGDPLHPIYGLPMLETARFTSR